MIYFPVDTQRFINVVSTLERPCLQAEYCDYRIVLYTKYGLIEVDLIKGSTYRYHGGKVWEGWRQSDLCWKLKKKKTSTKRSSKYLSWYFRCILKIDIEIIIDFNLNMEIWHFYSPGPWEGYLGAPQQMLLCVTLYLSQKLVLFSHF